MAKAPRSEKKPGRPQAPIDEEQLIVLAEKHWSIEQIAAFFRVSRDTIERRFSAVVEEARHRGAAKIIDKLWVRSDESDRILINLAERVIGPVKREMKVDLNTLSDDELAKLVADRLAKMGETQ